jgi:hypothetical protein
MKISKAQIIGLIMLALTSCSTTVGERMNHITVGMTKPEVIRIMGRPESSAADSDIEILHFAQDMGWYRFNYYFVKIVKGKVESYGPESKESRDRGH